jgi:hypothetical protein
MRGLAVASVLAGALAAVGLASHGGGRRPAPRAAPAPARHAAPSPPAAAVPTRTGALAIARRRSIAVVGRPVPVSAYAGYVAWSRRRRDGWALMQWHAGRVSAVAVAPSARPFDVDLGPDERGRPSAVYSRCRPLCRIYRVALDGSGERALGALSAGGAASESHPSIWRDRLAFVARRPGARSPTVYVARTGGRRPVAVRGGTRPRCAGQGGDCGARVIGLDLGARVLAFVWEIDSSDPDIGIARRSSIAARHSRTTCCPSLARWR